MKKEIQEILFERLEAIKVLYIDYTNNPFGVDITHDLRVSIRELRGLFNFIKPVIGDETYDKVNVPLREAAQVFGMVRELDVLTELAESVALDQPYLSEHYYDLFNELGKKRRKEMRRTFNKTNVQQIQNAIDTAQETIESLDLSSNNWDKYIGKRLDKKDKKLQKAYLEVDQADYEAVHDIRKDAKKNRYAAKYYKKATSAKTKPYRKAAEKIQDEFGELTDAHVNYELITEFADKVENQELRELFYKIRDVAQEGMVEEKS